MNGSAVDMLVEKYDVASVEGVSVAEVDTAIVEEVSMPVIDVTSLVDDSEVDSELILPEVVSVDELVVVTDTGTSHVFPVQSAKQSQIPFVILHNPCPEHVVVASQTIQ